MMSFPILLAHFFPETNPQDIDGMVERAQKIAAFSEFSWGQLGEAVALDDEAFRLQCVKTLFESQRFEKAVVLRMLDTFEALSEQESMLLPDVSEEVQAWYERFYTFACFLHFDSIGGSRQQYVLRSRFLLLAAIWEIPIYVNIQQYFSTLGWVKNMTDDAATLAGNVAANNTPLGTEGKTVKTIAEWIADFDEYWGGSGPSDRVDEFIESHIEISRLEPAMREALRAIVNVYWGLQGGFIWQEITVNNAPGLRQKTEEERSAHKSKTADEHYIEALYSADPADVVTWLRDYEEIAYWLYLTEKGEAFVRQILFVLLEKLDITNAEQVSIAMNFFKRLSEYGLEGIDNVLYYDEQDNAFHWDEGYFYIEDDGSASAGTDTPQERIELEV